MPWSSAVQAVHATENAPPPDSEWIRREALQRSWQRDKEVSARRLRTRWVVWALCRYGLPMLFVLGTAIAVWVWGLPQLRTTLKTLTSPAGSSTVEVVPINTLQVAPSVPVEVPATQVPASGPDRDDVLPTLSGKSDDAQNPIDLRPERSVSSLNDVDQAEANPDDTDTTIVPNPALKPDTGLNSKEP